MGAQSSSSRKVEVPYNVHVPEYEPVLALPGAAVYQAPRSDSTPSSDTPKYRVVPTVGGPSSVKGHALTVLRPGDGNTKLGRGHELMYVKQSSTTIPAPGGFARVDGSRVPSRQDAAYVKDAVLQDETRSSADRPNQSTSDGVASGAADDRGT